jgi:transcriptional regulator with XRE-family HTH domain
MEDSIILICNTGRMPDKKRIDLGPIGTAIAANVERLRDSQNLSYAELSRRLTELGRPIAPLGLTRIRDHERRVDVDDLVALALALSVSPTTLLLPHSAATTEAEAAGAKAAVTDGGEKYPLSQVWRWFVAESPIDEPPSYPPSRAAAEFRLRADPGAVIPGGFSVPINYERLQSMLVDFQVSVKDARFTRVEDARRNRDHLDGDD